MADCPRCHLPLQPDEYEGTGVLFCGNCWGYWLDHGALEKIMRSEVYEFSKEEAASVLSRWADHDASQVMLSENAACPICGESMEQAPFADGCPVVVDRCETDGVWLDTAEIKQLQVFVETRGKS